ncbi:hypothetical protein SOVF_145240 [Spinacia oleracea]|nr:hypothetical protein SOVF_145240 [Spinacia oleracea]
MDHSHNHNHPLNFNDHQSMMDGPDYPIPWTPPSNDNQELWDIVDAWINDPLPLINETPEVLQSSDDHHHHGNGHDVFNGGDVGRDVSVQGLQYGVGTEDQCPEDDHHQQEDQLHLQIVWPIAPDNDACSSCQVLREILLTNGI